MKFSLNSSSEPFALLGTEEVTKIKLFECIFTFTREGGFPYKYSSVQLLILVWLFGPHGVQHARPPCLSPTLGVYSNTCPLSQWCHPTISSSVILFLPASIFPSIRIFSNDSVLCIRWPKYWSFSFSICLSNEYARLISFKIDQLDLLAV